MPKDITVVEHPTCCPAEDEPEEMPPAIVDENVMRDTVSNPYNASPLKNYTTPEKKMKKPENDYKEQSKYPPHDANAGYWQVETDPKEWDKTAFKSHHGLKWFIRIPFGLKNAPETFQRVVDVIFSTVRWKFVLVYLDDILLF